MKNQPKLLLMMIWLGLAMTALASGVTNTASGKTKENFIVCIDPGHQQKGDSNHEHISPNGGGTKPRVSSGTAGVGTKKAEYEVNLEAAMILKELLKEQGYQVVITRETHDVNISNQERAMISNKNKADMTIRLHCDSVANGGKTGATLLVPSKDSEVTKYIYPASYKYAELLKSSLANAGVKVNGIFERSDITGFNWSKYPVVIFEMGFMSNWNEDKMLNDPAYQKKLMQCVVEAVNSYREIG